MRAETQTSRVSGSDPLGRYYTHGNVGAFLVSQMACAQPTQVLDLGAGGGSLSLAAMNRWTDARVVTVDIDSKARTNLHSIFDGAKARHHSHLRVNALDVRLPDIIILFVSHGFCVERTRSVISQ